MTDHFLWREKNTIGKTQLPMRSANVSDIIIKRLQLTIDIIDKNRWKSMTIDESRWKSILNSLGHRFSSISDINRLIAIDYYRLRSILSIIEFRISIGHVGTFAVAIKIFFRVYQITVAHICHGKTFFSTAKLSLPRQNLLSYGKSFKTYCLVTAKFCTAKETGVYLGVRTWQDFLCLLALVLLYGIV